MIKLRLAVTAASMPAALCLQLLASPCAHAQQEARREFHLPAQPLDVSLTAVARASGREIGMSANLVAGRTAPALDGVFTLEEAVSALLADSGLGFQIVDRAVIIGKDALTVRRADAETQDGSIVVTGSRIRGAPIASPLIRLDRETLVASGQTGLADLVRSLPQGYGGGVNVGVGANTGGNNIDTGGAATLNLRGLGSDATLTLLNGHRLAYNGSRQGVDVSAIPLGAVDRLEIVAEGASALYGSDAVAGVANIILRSDFDGLKVEGDVGAATEGGYTRQRYGATAGTNWRSGGILTSYEFARSTGILSNERSFARSRPGVTIYPPLKRHALVVSGHQDVTDTLTFAFDLLFNRRKTQVVITDNPAGNLAVSRTQQESTSRSIAIAPSLAWDLPGPWRATLSGVYGNERLFTRNLGFVGPTLTRSIPLCYCNDGKSVELAADGALFQLPGGVARAALGAGYRSNLLYADRGPGNPANVRATQDSYYGYGEVSLPLVAPAMGVPAVDRLNLSAALRYERYPGVDKVVTPKLGLIYAPVPGIELKSSWGRAFRAPTLLQQFGQKAVTLLPARSIGGTTYPATATGLVITGGNPDLKPERARTWTVSADIHPAALVGLRLQLSYFDTQYRDRIVTPLAFLAQSLSNPLYADYLSLNPSPAEAAQLIASAVQFSNAVGGTIDPSRAVAIVDNRSVNAGRQSIHGVDVLADYQFDLWGGQMTASLNASRLHFDQQLTPGQPRLPRSGILFTPPHWRGRASVGWLGGGTSLNATVSRIGGVDDVRTATTVRVDGMTLVDFTARHSLERASGALRNVTFFLSLLNAFDARPAQIASTSSIDSTYDSTNYLPIGRVVNFGISKSW